MKNLSNINLGDANVLNEDEMKSLKGGEGIGCSDSGHKHYVVRCTEDKEVYICARNLQEAMKKAKEACEPTD